MRSGIAAYIAACFGIAWLCWGLCVLIVGHNTGVPLVPVIILGSFAPFIAAGICTWREAGLAGMARFYARALNLRMGWLVFAMSVFLIPMITTLSAWIHAWQFHQAFAFQMRLGQAPMAYIWLFFLGGAVGEEFGWSYLSDRLDEQFSPRGATLLLGAIWGFWHAPLFFLDVPGLTQHFIPFYAFMVSAICLRFLFAWAYHRSNRNILSNLLMHNSFNFGISIVVIVPQEPERYHLRFWYVALLSGICAYILQRLAPAPSILPPQAPVRERVA